MSKNILWTTLKAVLIKTDILICTFPNTGRKRRVGDSQSPPANLCALAETCSCLLLQSFKTSGDRNPDGECVYKTAGGGVEIYEGKELQLLHLPKNRNQL